MNPREELEELRRLDELERKQNSSMPSAEDPGFAQSALIGVGRTTDRMLQGVKQMGLQVGTLLPDQYGGNASRQALQAQAVRMAQDDAAYQPLRDMRPWATGIGEAAPLLAAPVLGTSVAGIAASSALPGLIEYGSAEDKLRNASIGAAGGAAGALAGKAIGRVMQPYRGTPTPDIQAGLDAASSIGYNVPVGQRIGSRAVQTVEQQLAKNPISARGAQALNDANQQAINRAAAKAIGENATHLTDDVLAAAKARIGAKFDDIAGRNIVNVGGDQLMDALINVDMQQRALGKFAQPRVTALVDKGLDLAAKGSVSGKTYQTIRSELGKQSQAAFTGGNSTLGSALKLVQQSLDDAADASISAADRDAWRMARQQYQALKLVSKQGNVVEGGNVSAARLASKLDRQRGAVAPELAAIGKIGESFKPLPDSGTAGNAVAQLLLTGGAGLMGPQALVASILGPIAGQKFLMSKPGQKYLTRGFATVTPEMERLLTLAGAGLLGGPSTIAAGR